MHGFTATILCLTAYFVSLSSAQDSNSALVISEDGNCGGTTGQTCLGSSFGNCCSGKGYCGSTTDYCNAECQIDFGFCVANSSSISSDGRCGTTDPSNQICIGSSFGNCCSPTGWCGSTDDYCGSGCQGDFGQCGFTSSNTSTAASSSSSSTTLSTATATSSTAAASSSTSSAAASSASADADAQAQAQSSSSQEARGMSTGAKAGVGVGIALAVLALMGALFIFLRRRSRKNKVSELEEKADHPTPAPAYETNSDTKDSYFDSKSSDSSMPPELGDHRQDRAELGGAVHSPMSELDAKTGKVGSVELPSSRD